MSRKGSSKFPVTCSHRLCREKGDPHLFQDSKRLSSHHNKHDLQAHQLCFVQYGPDRCSKCKECEEKLLANQKQCKATGSAQADLVVAQKVWKCLHTCVGGEPCPKQFTAASSFYFHLASENAHPGHNAQHDCKAIPFLEKVSSFIITIDLTNSSIPNQQAERKPRTRNQNGVVAENDVVAELHAAGHVLCGLEEALEYLKANPSPKKNGSDKKRRYAVFEVILWHLAGKDSTVEALEFFGHHGGESLTRKEFFYFYIRYKNGIAQNSITEVGLRLRLGKEVTVAKFRQFKKEVLSELPDLETVANGDGMVFNCQEVFEGMLSRFDGDIAEVVVGLDGAVATNRKSSLEIVTLKITNEGELADAHSPVNCRLLAAIKGKEDAAMYAQEALYRQSAILFLKFGRIQRSSSEMDARSRLSSLSASIWLVLAMGLDSIPFTRANALVFGVIVSRRTSGNMNALHHGSQMLSTRHIGNWTRRNRRMLLITLESNENRSLHFPLGIPFPTFVPLSLCIPFVLLIVAR